MVIGQLRVSRKSGTQDVRGQNKTPRNGGDHGKKIEGKEKKREEKKRHIKGKEKDPKILHLDARKGGN